MRTVVVMCLVAMAATSVHAQAPADVPALIKLIDNQPADMDRAAWKDKRRDAARKLAQSKDKRAVPVLMKLAEHATFDIIGEIAIEGLGTLGDQAAVSTLQKIVGDTSRDKGQRDLARKSLAKLGASADVPATGGGTGSGGSGLETGGGEGSGAATTGAGNADTGVGSVLGSGSSGAGSLLGTHTSTEIPPLPELPDDTIAAYDRLTFAGGTASFAYDTIRKELDFNADVSGLYQRRIERQSMAWGIDVGAGVVTGVVNPTGAPQTRGAEITANADGEVRFYSGGAYAVGKASVALQTTYVSDTEQNMGNNLDLTTSQADLEVALGAGYGRVLDIGAAIRVRRLGRALDAARALGKPIDAATSKKLQLTWWALRGERSAYRQLVVTIAILREAGVLLGEPDSGLAYEILNVLRDTQLFVRPSGFDAQLAVGGGYLRVPAGLVAQDYENGQIEQLLASVGYGVQLDDDKLEFSGTAYGRLRLFAGNDTNNNANPSPWGAGVSGTMTRFTYGEHGDPFGAFDLTGIVAVSDPDRMGLDKGSSITGQLGFTLLMNQASGIRLAAQVVEDSGTFQIGAQLQGTYGLLDGTFAR